MANEKEKRKKYLEKCSLIVVKIGTSSLTHENGLLNISKIDSVIRQIADLHNDGYKIIVVTSGAIGAGMGKLGMSKRPYTISEKQAVAAVGQGILLHMYEKIFSEYDLTIGQILLTKGDVFDDTRLNNVQNTFKTLLKKNIIPVVNENDAVITDEIKVGDNDTLSAIVSVIVKADLLIILSDIDGMYDKDPNKYADAKLIQRIHSITPNLENCAQGSSTALGTGGMATKIKAAKIVKICNAAMVIANSDKENILTSIMHGENIGTWFESSKENYNEVNIYAK